MEGRAQPGRDLRGVRVVTARVGGGEHDAGGLGLELDRAVEVEVPVEAVVVVAHRGEEGDDEPALAPDLPRAGPQVGVLPEDAVVLLVDADGVGQGAGVPELVGDDGVDVGDLAEAVAPQLEGVGVAADQVLAGVEVVLPGAHGGRVGVGHDHLGDRGPVDDRAHPAALVEADLVEDQPLPGVEPDPQGPLLPGQQVALERQAGALGLGDGDGLLRRARRAADGRVVVVPRARRDRHDPGVDDLVDDAVEGVDVGHQTVDRVRPGRVLRVLLVERQPAQQPSAGLLGVLVGVDAGRQRCHPDVGDVQAAGRHAPPATAGRWPAAPRPARTPRRAPAAGRWPRPPARRRSRPPRRPRRPRRRRTSGPPGRAAAPGSGGSPRRRRVCARTSALSGSSSPT